MLFFDQKKDVNQHKLYLHFCVNSLNEIVKIKAEIYDPTR